MKLFTCLIPTSLLIIGSLAAPASLPLVSIISAVSSFASESSSMTTSIGTSSSTALPTGFRTIRRRGLFAPVSSSTEPASSSPSPSPSPSPLPSPSLSLSSSSPSSTKMIRIRRINSTITPITTQNIELVHLPALPQKSTSPTNILRARDTMVQIFHSPRISIKKGICFTTPSSVTAFGTSLVWAYNWAPIAGGLFPDLGLGFIPMLFDTNNDGWMIAAQKAIDSGAKHLLAFNEPDLQTEANVSPAAAAASWKINMQPFASQGIKLISPAVSNGPLGIVWMKEFISQCVGCTIDGVAVHFYNTAANTATNVKYFYSYLNLIHNLFGIPLWLTEFSGGGSIAEQKAFLQNVLPFLERSPNIMAYAAFGGNFVDSTGTLTELGLVYKNTV